MPSVVSRSQVLDQLPPAWPESPRAALAAAAQAARKLVVLDDDPTGTQTVHDIQVVTDWSVDTLIAALEQDAPGFYILTNSRSLPVTETQRLHRELAAHLLVASARTGVAFAVFSRSDSTLRGHYPVETDVLADALGPFDATLLVPCFEAGGRLTLAGVHYVTEGDQLVPAAETPFAGDAAFGYRHSFLPDWVEEKTRGAIRAANVAHLTLERLRRDGPAGVAQWLQEIPRGGTAVCDAVSQRDLEVIALGLLQAEATGRRHLVRTAASLVAARLGLAARPLLNAGDFSPAADARGGLVVVGSYVPKTTAQLRALRNSVPVHEVELRVPNVLSPPHRKAAIVEAARLVAQLLVHGKLVLLVTSREVVTGGTPDESLSIIRRVSAALVEVVRTLQVRPRFLVAKGGITSSDVATAALNVRRATVRGQLLPGVPVWRLGPESKYPGLDYVIFPGNVGDDQALANAVRQLQPNLS